MSVVEKAIRLYAWKNNYQVFNIVEGEVDSRVLHIQLFDTTIPLNLSTSTVRFYATKSDNTNVFEDCDIVDATNGEIRVAISEQMTAVPGDTICWIQVIGFDGTDLRFTGMTMRVSDCPLDSAVRSANDFPALVNAARQATMAAEEANTAALRANSSTANVNSAISQVNSAAVRAQQAAEDAETAANAVSNLEQQVTSMVTDELAKRGQLKPEFANSIEECTDTSKLYVLPDGYVYAYMMTEVEKPAYSNQLERSIGSDGNPYIGSDGQKGWNANKRLNSSGVEKDHAGMFVTGFIPVKLGDVIYLQDVGIYGETGSSAGATDMSYMYFSIYDASRNTLVSATTGFLSSYNGAVVYDDSERIIQINTAKAVYAYSDETPDWRNENMAYFRLSANDISNSSIITVNEPIGGTVIIEKEYAWANTGHTFVPADYEDRIISLENAKTDLDKRVVALESIDASGVPEYVKTAAEEVIDKIIAAQGGRTFTFAAVSDLHYETGNYTDGILHMSQALNYIGSRIKLDAFAVLGDYVSSYPSSDYTDSMDDFQDVNHLLNEMRFAPNLRVQGNHDFVEARSPVVYRYVQSFSDDVVWGDRLGGYYYRDFADYKLRVIALNMMEANNGNGSVWSANQMNWLIQSLDLSGKSDASQWQILLISHHPLDWYYADYTNGDNVTVVIPYILEAYRNGTTWSHSRLNVSCNFSGKNAAKLIGNIHGHIHNYMVDYLYLNSGSKVKSGVKRIATPEACIGRANNSYVGSIWEDSATYEKTVNTANDTAFCVYCVNMDIRTITAVCYGAGTDRTITY